MKQYSDLEYLQLSKGQKFGYRVASFFAGIPKAIGRFFLGIGKGLKNAGLAVAREAKDIVQTFVQGDGREGSEGYRGNLWAGGLEDQAFLSRHGLWLSGQRADPARTAVPAL